MHKGEKGIMKNGMNVLPFARMMRVYLGIILVLEWEKTFYLQNANMNFCSENETGELLSDPTLSNCSKNTACMEQLGLENSGSNVIWLIIDFINFSPCGYIKSFFREERSYIPRQADFFIHE